MLGVCACHRQVPPASHLTGLGILKIMKLCRLSYGVVWSKDYRVLLVVIVLFFFEAGCPVALDIHKFTENLNLALRS